VLRTAAAAFLAASLLAGSAAGSRAPELFAVADAFYPKGDFYGAALVRVDPRTLQPHAQVLRLGDAVTSRTLSPDGRTIAFGGENFDEILFVDLEQPTRVTPLKVVPHDDAGSSIYVVGWQRPSRLIAIATIEGAWWQPHPSQLLVVDPTRERVSERTPIEGAVLRAISLRDGTIALLVVTARFPRLVIIRPNGSTWSRSLARLDLRGHERARVAHTTYAAEHVPALAADGRGRVFVVAPDRPIAEVGVRARSMRYHDVALPHEYLAYPPPMTPGTGGVHLTYATSAAWLGGGRLAIGGSDELPAPIPGYGVGHRYAVRLLQIVDTRSWRRVRTIHARSCQQLQRVWLCGASASGFPPDGKGSRGATLVAYDERWKVLYTKTSRRLWWTVSAERLFAGTPSGQQISELDPASGRAIREIKPSPLRNQMWPLDLFSWTPH
jgi:hypothetical protein